MKSVCVFILAFSNLCIADEIDLVWKARGIKALEDGQEISDKIKSIGNSKKEKSKLECEFMRERAYMGFARKETEAIVAKKGKDLYARILLFGSDLETQVSLLFDPAGHKLNGWKVPTLGSGWQVATIRGTDHIFILGPQCSFILDLDHPLSIDASVSAK